MKKIITTMILLLAGGIAIFSFTSAQFTPADCEGESHCSAPTKGVNYKDYVIYIGDEGDEFDLGFQQNFDKQRILLEESFISDNKGFSEDEIMGKIMDNIADIQKASTLIINTSNFDIVLQTLGKANLADDLQLKDKTIYITTNSNRYFLKRTLAKQIKSVELETIYTLPEEKLLNFLSMLSLGKITNHESYITPFSLSFHETPKFLIISYLIDHLIYNGFPIELISLFLILSFGALLISILRQVVGFSVFGIYSPLLFAVSMSILGVPLSISLLLIGFLAKLLIRLFTKKIYLLHNAKSALLIILYFLLLLVFFGLNEISGSHRIPMELFSNGFIIFPFIFIIIVSDKVFNEGFKLFSKGRRVAFAEFLIVSFAVYGLLYRTGLKHLLLAFPELLLLIFFLNIFVGRFTGLQLLEYFRFMPLLKNSSGTEEEEE